MIIVDFIIVVIVWEYNRSLLYNKLLLQFIISHLILIFSEKQRHRQHASINVHIYFFLFYGQKMANLLITNVILVMISKQTNIFIVIIMMIINNNEKDICFYRCIESSIISTIPVCRCHLYFSYSGYIATSNRSWRVIAERGI